MGRKKALTNDARTLAVLNGLGKIHATREEAAAVLGVSRPTLWKFLDEFPEAIEIFEAGQDSGKAELRRMQWNAAKKGNTTMLIWLGKQLLKQRDDAAMADIGTKESIDALRDEIKRKLARVIDSEPEGELAKEPKPE
jgi:hypothetical protein